MKTNVSTTRRLTRCVIAITCTLMLTPGQALLFARSAPAVYADDTAVKIPAEQLDSLVAPIALYPDNLLSQTLVASTYPLEIIQLQQWLERNPDLLKDQKKLAEAVKKQPWDASIQAMAALPDVVKRLSDDVQWTTDLGNAFLAQQKDVMDAIQRMRNKAQDTGALASNQQQKVETQTVESKEVIVIQQANPEVVYVRPLHGETMSIDVWRNDAHRVWSVRQRFRGCAIPVNTRPRGDSRVRRARSTLLEFRGPAGHGLHRRDRRENGLRCVH